MQIHSGYILLVELKIISCALTFKFVKKKPEQEWINNNIQTILLYRI